MCKIDFDIFENIDKAYKNAKELGFFQNFFRIPDCIFSPRRFWHQYKELSFKSKFIQFLTYAALYAFALWIMPYKNLSSKELLSYVMIQAVGVIVYAIVAYIANIVCGKGKGLFKFLLILCLYIKFIGGFIHLVVLKFYYTFENPLVLSIAAVIPLALELMNFSHAAIVWQKGKYKVVGTFILSIMILNIYDYVINKTKWDMGHHPYQQNLIEAEMRTQANSLNYFYDVPMYISYNENDSVDGVVVHDICKLFNPTKKIDLKIYDAKLKDDIDSLWVIINRCQYKMNKDLFQDLLDVKKDVLTINESGSFSETPMIFAGHLLNHDRSIECYAIQEYDRSITERNFYAFEKYNKALERHHEAFAVNKLGYLWHPVLYYYGNGLE